MKINIEGMLKALRPYTYIAKSGDPHGIDGRLVSHTDKHSHIAEQYRILQTHFYALLAEKKAKTIVITSSEKEEGKTVTSCNLAITLAADPEKRVALVDCDFRKPDIHTLLNIKRTPGMSDAISGACSVADLIKPPVVDNLFVLPSGSAESNPSELLRRHETKDIIEALKSSFDYIIIDTPPIMPVSDSRIVGALCDAVIVVARSDKSSKKSVKEAFWLLETAHTRPLACILTDHQPPFYRSIGYSHY